METFDSAIKIIICILSSWTKTKPPVIQYYFYCQINKEKWKRITRSKMQIQTPHLKKSKFNLWPFSLMLFFTLDPFSSLWYITEPVITSFTHWKITSWKIKIHSQNLCLPLPYQLCLYSGLLLKESKPKLELKSHS